MFYLKKKNKGGGN